jgi:hypothetical protein
MYTYLHVYCADKAYLPDSRVLRDMIYRFKLQALPHVWIYNKPCFWNDQPTPLMELEDQSIDDYIGLLSKKAAASVMCGNVYSEWCEDIADEIGRLPKEVSDGTITQNLILIWGPSSIGDHFSYITIAETSFDILLMGDGCPHDSEECLRLMAELPGIKSLLDYLENLTERKWHLALTLG